LADAKNDKGKFTKVSVSAQLKKIKNETDGADERKQLNAYLDLIEQESAANKKVKEAQNTLDAKVAAQYTKLSEDQIKTLVVDDKWLTTLAFDVQTELDRVSQAMTGRIKLLAERYAEPLPQIATEVSDLSKKVEKHLKKMGFI
jgi:type I restriction enzyme M protein